MNQTQRLHALDNLRAVAMWLGIVLHVAMNHIVGWSPLPWRDPETTVAANVLVSFIHTFRMPVFFIVAGFFAALLAERGGMWGMLRHRLRRLGVPFALVWPLLFLLTGLLVSQYLRLMHPEAMGFSGALEGDADRPSVNTLHLWFIYYLLWFCLAAATCGYGMRLMPASFTQAIDRVWLKLASSWWSVIVLTAPLAFIASFHPYGVVRTTSSFMLDASEFFHYGLFFLYGWVVYRHRETLLEQYARHCWHYFFAGMMLFAVSQYLFGLIAREPAHIEQIRNGIAVVYTAATWLMSLAALGLFLRFLPYQNRLLRYLAESAYWVYLVHMLGTIGFGVLLFNAPLGPFAKMALNITATTFVCLATYHVLVRFTFIGTLLNGRRHEYQGGFTPVRIGLAVAGILACFFAFTQIKFARSDTPLRATAPAAVQVPADVAAFLDDLGEAYGSADSAAVAAFLASDFRHQGMDRGAFLHHLKVHQPYLGRLDIKPVAHQIQDEGIRLTAYALSPNGVVAPSLQLLPLHAGATMVKEGGAWKLRGNQKYTEAGLYKEQSTILADFAPSDLEAYGKLVPAGYGLPQTPYVRVSVTSWTDMEPPQIPYRLSQLSILVNKNGADFWHILAMPETDWLAVEAGKALGFPKFVADVDISRSIGNAWQVDLRRGGKPLAEFGFDPILVTKTTRVDMPSNTDDWVVFGKAGRELKAVMTELAPPYQQKTGYGWMTVHPRASPWKDVLAPGSRATAVTLDTQGPRKLHMYAINDVAVPAEVQQLLSRVADAWAGQDMEGVLANYHPAFKVTNQRTLVSMRRLYALSRRYEWKVRDFYEEGGLAYIKGEVQTDVGALPMSARLFKENGRWFFYGDGGSKSDREIMDIADATREARPGEFEVEAKKASQEVLAAKDDLRFDTATRELGPFTSYANAIFKPAGAGPFPAVVLLHDCSGRMGVGMRGWIEEALQHGYAAMVVDSMRGHPTNCMVPLRVSVGRRVKDAYDAFDHLRRLPFIDPGRIAAAGFSQGGVVSLLLASKEFAGMYGRTQRFAAVATVYPLCYFAARYAKYDIDFLRPDSDIPLQVLMGGDDIYAPAYDCMPGLKKLKQSGAPVEWHTFPGAGHGWDLPEASGRRTMSFRGDLVAFNYDRSATQESRRMVFDFFERRMEKGR